jgi:hypothetical protein
MKIEEMNHWSNYGCAFSGKLAVVEYQKDMENNPKWGTWGSGIVYDYAEEAERMIKEKYGEKFKVLLNIPTLVCRLLVE